MRLSYFFSKKECILVILEGLIFKIFLPVGPNHGGATLVTEPQPPQSQKCGYGPVHPCFIKGQAPSLCHDFLLLFFHKKLRLFTLH